MKIIASYSCRFWCVVAAGLLTTANLLCAEAEDVIRKSFKVDPGGHLVVEADRGSIDVKGADTDAVDIEVTRKATGTTEATARELLQNHDIQFTAEGNRVEVRARLTKSPPRSWFGRQANLQVRYRITVPRKFNLNLQTAGGAVSIATVEGELQATTAGGNLTFTEVAGPVRGRTSGGSITATACKGDLEVGTGGGGLQLSGIEGNVDAKTSGGSIKVSKVDGKCAVETSGGGIDLADIAGPLNASTSGGSVVARFAVSPKHDSSLSTSGGNVTVTVPGEAAFDLDARTSGGRVASDLPVTMVVQGEQKRGTLAGKVNGGGPKLTLHTSGGNITLKKP